MIDELKPYPEYKDSGLPWLGMVPAHWDIRRLRHTVEMMVSNIDKHTKSGEQPVRLCNYVNVYKNEKITERLQFMRATASKDEIARFRLQLGDVVITKDSEIWTDIGVPALVEYAAPDLVCGYHLAILRPRREMLIGEFLLRALQSQGVAAQFHVGASGVTRYGLSHADIKNILIPLPAVDEQAAIVRFLDHANGKIERAIRAKKNLIALLNEQKQAIIHRAVTRGLDANVKLKPSGIPWLGDVPEHWENVPLKVVSTIQSGVTLGKFYVGERLTEFPYLRVANVQAGRLDLSNVKTLRLPSTEAMCSMLEVGDVLMTEGGDPDKLGRGCVWNGEISPCLHQNHIFAVRPIRERLLPEFLSALLGSHYAQQYFLRTAKQTTNLASTNKTTIGRFRVLLPCVREQEAILRWLQAKLLPVATTIARAEREIMLLREYRTTLTADIVTGKLDVREAVKRLPAEAEEALPADDLPDGLEDEDTESLSESGVPSRDR